MPGDWDTGLNLL